MAFEYACHYALAVMFEQIDAVQIAATPDGNLVGFDFTDCFRLSDLTEAILKKAGYFANPFPENATERIQTG